MKLSSFFLNKVYVNIFFSVYRYMCRDKILVVLGSLCKHFVFGPNDREFNCPNLTWQRTIVNGFLQNVYTASSKKIIWILFFASVDVIRFGIPSWNKSTMPTFVWFYPWKVFCETNIFIDMLSFVAHKIELYSSFTRCQWRASFFFSCFKIRRIHSNLWVEWSLMLIDSALTT